MISPHAVSEKREALSLSQAWHLYYSLYMKLIDLYRAKILKLA